MSDTPSKPSFRKRLFSSKSVSPQSVSTTASDAERQDMLGELALTAIPIAPLPDETSDRTTLTSKRRRNLFYRGKANISSNSEGALSVSTTVKPSIRSRSSLGRPSFISRVVFRVVPCVYPVHDSPIEISDNLSETRPSLIIHDSSKQSAEVPSLLAIPPINIIPPPSPTESEVIVPPPPSTHLLPEEETDGVTSGAVQPPGSTGHTDHVQISRSITRDSSDDSEGTTYTDDETAAQRYVFDEQAEEDRLIKNGGSGIPVGPDGQPKPLLPPIAPEHVGRKCLVLDLDETLVHSSFKAVQQADFIVPVEIEYHWHHFHVLKRPGVDNFLKAMGEIYEVVVFTASLGKYADPVLDKLDIHHSVAHRLFRESCFSHKGNYVKDLSQLGRPIADTIILDNSPASYIFHPNNAVPVSSWFNDPHDAELTDLVPFLADLTSVPDVRGILEGSR